MWFDGLITVVWPFWQLSRFNTRESWHICYPAIWGLCFSIKYHDLHLDKITLFSLIVSNWACMTLVNGALCTWNDFLDAKIDTFSPRTASRPLPSGRCSPRSALAWFIAQLVFTNGAIYLLLGSATYATLAPCLVIALVYPLSKRYIRCPQLVLAPTVAWPIFAGWISAQSAARLPERINICCGLMWLSHAIWNVYYDTCYGLQDIVGDAHAGVGSMAKFLGMRCFKPALMGMMVVALGTFGLATMQLRCSLFFWVLTVGVWGLTVPLQLWMLDFRIPKSGGWVLRFNLDLGMYLTAVIMVEVLVLNVREIS